MLATAGMPANFIIATARRAEAHGNALSYLSAWDAAVSPDRSGAAAAVSAAKAHRRRTITGKAGEAGSSSKWSPASSS
jgi:hypothetical protein